MVSKLWCSLVGGTKHQLGKVQTRVNKEDVTIFIAFSELALHLLPTLIFYTPN